VRLILASASPRRLDILRTLGIEPDIRPVPIDESAHHDESAEALVMRLAAGKAAAALDAIRAQGGGTAAPSRLILGADTIVVLDGEPLGKPVDLNDAIRMLTRLSGRTHQVMTGLTLLGPDAGRELTDVCTTRVSFAAISPAQIHEYASSGEPMDKAGAYGIQEGAGRFVERIDGSYSNVVGLPVELFEGMLARLGLTLNDLRGP
jgi:septum formation protein